MKFGPDTNEHYMYNSIKFLSPSLIQPTDVIYILFLSSFVVSLVDRQWCDQDDTTDFLILPMHDAKSVIQVQQDCLFCLLSCVNVQIDDGASDKALNTDLLLCLKRFWKERGLIQYYAMAFLNL